MSKSRKSCQRILKKTKKQNLKIEDNIDIISNNCNDFNNPKLKELEECKLKAQIQVENKTKLPEQMSQSSFTASTVDINAFHIEATQLRND